MFYFALIASFLINPVINTKDCEKAPNDKCLGLAYKNLGKTKTNENLYVNYTTTTFESCILHCINDWSCYMASYKLSKGKCSLFNKTSSVFSYFNDYKTFTWECCNTSKGEIQHSRCTGFWSYNISSKIFNSYHTSPLFQSKTLDKNQCQKACLNNPICGAINVVKHMKKKPNDFICELILNFPKKNLKHKPDQKYVYYIWTCIDNYTIPKPHHKCFPRNKFQYKGFWIEITRNGSYNKALGQPLISFYTFLFKHCLNACTKTPNCEFPIFSETTYRCILIGLKNSSCSDTIEDDKSRFIIYKWHSCKEFSRPTNKLSNKITRKCGKIVDNTHLMIAHNNCGHQPHKSWYHKCASILLKNTKYNIIENCQNNQSFQILNQVNKTTVQIFTGYDNFWLYNVSEHNFLVIPLDYCRYYDADFDVYKDVKSLNIIKRSQWFAMPPKPQLIKFKTLPIKFIIITGTSNGSCDCFTKLSCAHIIRKIQTANLVPFLDIIYHFIVTGNGDIYEGVEVQYQGHAASIDYNEKSIFIAFCGRSQDLISLPVQKSTKMLINYLVNSGVVSQDYTLLMMKDIQKSYTSQEAQHIIALWPRYKGYLRRNCSIFKENIILFNVIVICVVLALMLAIYFYPLLVVNKTVSLADYGTFHFSLINERQNKIDLANKFVSPYFTKIYFLTNKKPLGGFRRKCGCKASLYCLLDKGKFLSKYINLYEIVNLTEIENCTSLKNDEFNGFIYFVDMDYEVVDLIYLHNICKYTKDTFLEILKKKIYLPCNSEIEQYFSQTLTMNKFYECKLKTYRETILKRTMLEEEFCKSFDTSGPIRYCD